MSRKATTDLYNLIRSLSKVEKQTVTLFANYYSSGTKNYLLLFELLERQKNFNEDSIKKQLREKGVKTSLAQLKGYLLELIFKSLRFHHSDKTIEGEMNNLITDSELCHRKGLKDMRDKLVKKAKHISDCHEKYGISLQIVEKEWNFSGPGSFEILEEHLSIRHKMADQNEYRRLFLVARQLLFKGEIRDDVLKNEWDQLIHSPLMRKENIPVNFEERYNYYRVWRLYYERTNDFQNCALYQDLIIAHFESRPQWLKENPEKYMSQLNNLIVSKGQIKSTEEAKQAMNKLIKMEKWPLNQPERISLNNYIILGYSNVLFALIYANKYDELSPSMSRAEDFVMGHTSETHYRAVLYNVISSSHFIEGNISKALVWNNLFLNEPEAKHEDAYASGKLFNLILHYELGHSDLLPYITRSTYRYLFRRKRLYKTEDMILAFIRNKMPKANTQRELIDFFKELKEELENITKDTYEAKALEDFDIISWLTGKIQNRPILEILREKNRSASA